MCHPKANAFSTLVGGLWPGLRAVSREAVDTVGLLDRVDGGIDPLTDDRFGLGLGFGTAFGVGVS